MIQTRDLLSCVTRTQPQTFKLQTIVCVYVLIKEYYMYQMVCWIFRCHLCV